MNLRNLEPTIWVSGQITTDDLDTAVTLGVRRVISNRPDHEEPGQPTAAEMATEAEARGLIFIHAPARGMPGTDVVATVGSALAEDEPILMFCKSGMRSAAAWAMASAASGRLDRETILKGAADAGFDLGMLALDSQP